MYYKNDPYYKQLTKTQLEVLKKGCPECGSKMHGVPNQETGEIYLFCNNCDVLLNNFKGIEFDTFNLIIKL